MYRRLVVKYLQIIPLPHPWRAIVWSKKVTRSFLVYKHLILSDYWLILCRWILLSKCFAELCRAEIGDMTPIAYPFHLWSTIVYFILDTKVVDVCYIKVIQIQIFRNIQYYLCYWIFQLRGCSVGELCAWHFRSA